jgi:hypothetical protein
VPAFQAVSKLKSPLPGKSWPASWLVVFVLLTLMIGLRHKVGGDWTNYLGNLEFIKDLPFDELFSGTRGDPADRLFNWLSAQSGLGIYLTNSVYGALFSWGLLAFCLNQPRPWLALTVAVPYLITVVSMGYSRQGVAIGLAMLGLVALNNKSIFKFLFWIGFAATFHKSAIILVMLPVMVGARGWILTVFLASATLALLFGLMLQEAVNDLRVGYIDAEYASSGAAIRIAMNALPATLFLLFRRRFQMPTEQRSFWTWVSLSAIALVVFLYISPSSTAVDRIALYWIPLQLFVWSRIPDAMGRPGGANAGWVYAVVGYSATVHFVWLFFATHAHLWLPYQFYPWVWMWQ